MIHLLSLFRTPTPEQIAQRELTEARLACLAALTHREHADSVVAFRTSQIDRLERFLNTQSQ